MADLIACTGCKALKPVTEYYKLHSRSDALASVCKMCAAKSANAKKEKTIIDADAQIRCLLCKELKRGAEFHERADRRSHRPVCLQCFKAYAEKWGSPGDKKYRLPEILIIDGHKECNTCHQNLTLESFAKNLSAPHGLDWRCKECQRIHRESYVGKRHAENPNIYWKSRLKNQHIYGDFSIAFVRNLYESHKYCEYCRIPFTDPREAHFEHRIPRAKGGPTTPENVTFACDQCNRAKNDMTDTEFMAWIERLYGRLHEQFGKAPIEMKTYPLHEYAAKAQVG